MKVVFKNNDDGERALLATKAHVGCSCPDTTCIWHGKCYECVRLHRINGTHLPRCLQFLLTDAVNKLAQVTEVGIDPIEYVHED